MNFVLGVKITTKSKNDTKSKCYSKYNTELIYFFQNPKENLLAGVFPLKLINMWSLIRPCWLENNFQINTCVVMLIRATRVVVEL